MSDFGELFTSPSDPKHLAWEEFVAKEEGNVAKGVAALPIPLQQFVPEVAVTLGDLGAAVATSGGSAVGGLIGAALPTLEGWFAQLLGRLGATSQTAAGQAAIAAAGAAAQAAVAHLATQASAGILAVAGAAQPSVSSSLSSSSSTSVPVAPL